MTLGDIGSMPIYAPNNIKIKISDLKKARPENVIRLANWLKLKINNMSIQQIIKLVYWRITRNFNSRH